MRHFTCDLCGDGIDEQRFVARVELYPAFDPELIAETDLEQDNLTEIAGLLSDLEMTGELELDPCEPRSYCFDLCPECQRRFRRDPLGGHRPRRMRFSEN